MYIYVSQKTGVEGKHEKHQYNIDVDVLYSRLQVIDLNKPLLDIHHDSIAK